MSALPEALTGAISAARRPAGRRLLLAASIASIAWTLRGYGGHLRAAFARGRGTSFDDAYMFVRYADHLLAGHGVAWNPDGAPTLGATSLPYVLLVASLRRIVHLPPGLLLVVVSWTFGLLAALVLSATSARILGATTLGARALVAAVVLPLLLRTDVLVFHALSGMETTLALFVNALLVHATILLVERPSDRRSAACGALFYAACAVRPDGALLGVLLALTFYRLVPRDRSRRLLAICAGVAAALLGADVAVKFAVFGDPRPLSFFVKHLGYYSGYVGARSWNPFKYLAAFVTSFFAFVALPIAFAGRGQRRELAALLAPVVLGVAYYFTVLQIMGLSARFYVPLLPCLVAASAVGLRDRLRDPAPWSLPSMPLARAAALGVLVLFPTALEPRLARAYASVFLRADAAVVATRVTTPARRRLPSLGMTSYDEMSRVAADLPAGASFASTEVGFLGAAAPEATILDLSGLNDVHLAHHGFSVAYVLDRRPELLWIPPHAYTGMIEALLDSEDFLRDYDLYPWAYEYGLAIRREGPRHADVEGAVRRSWERAYPGRPMDDYRARVDPSGVSPMAEWHVADE